MMVLLTLTDALLSAIHEYNALPRECRDEPIGIAATSFIDHKLIQKVSQALLNYQAEVYGAECDTAGEKYMLDKLLQGCSVYIAPKPSKAEPSEAYKALMAELRKQAEEASYKALLCNSKALCCHETAEDEYTLKDLKTDLSMIANVLLTTLGTSAAVWATASSWETPIRFAMAFTSGLIVCLAEVAVLGSYYRKIDQAKKVESRKIEKKEIIRTWVIEDNAQ